LEHLPAQILRPAFKYLDGLVGSTHAETRKPWRSARDGLRPRGRDRSMAATAWCPGLQLEMFLEAIGANGQGRRAK